MTIDHSGSKTSQPKLLGAENICCDLCQTDKNLIIESVATLEGEQPQLLAVEYSCGKCEAYYAHDATAESVAYHLAHHHQIWP